MNRRDFATAESLSRDLVLPTESKPLAKILADHFPTNSDAAVPTKGTVYRRIESVGEKVCIIEIRTSKEAELPRFLPGTNRPGATRRPPAHTPYLEDGVFVWLLGGVTVFMLAGAACLLAMMFSN